MQYEELQRVYGREEYYWGTEPNALAERTLTHLPEDPSTLTLLDLGAGEGRDAVYFAAEGLDVLAIDVAPNGLEKAERLAADRGVELDTLQADLNDLDPALEVDVLYSAGTLQYLRPEKREPQFDRFKRATSVGGIHSLFAFVDHPEVPPAPDWGDNEFFYRPGEIRRYYDDWELLSSRAFVFEDDSGGEPHRHAAEELLVRKVLTDERAEKSQ